MRVLHIIPQLGRAGAERLVLDICNELQQRTGVEVRLLTLRQTNEYPELSKTLNIIQTSSWHRFKRVGHSSDYADYVNLLKEYDPHIVHAHLHQADSFARGCIRPSAVYFTHFHGPMPKYHRFRLGMLASRHQLRHALLRWKLLKSISPPKQNFIGVSRSTYELVVNQVSKFGTAYLLPNAVDLSRFKPKSGVGSLPPKPLLVNLGRFTPVKNQSFLIDVVLELANRSFPATLVLAGGNGSSLLATKEKVGNLDLDQYVRFANSVSNPEELLSNAFLYCHAAVKEAFGLSMLEAMACGTPVLSLDAFGNRDFMRNGINGYMFSEPDVEAYASKIEELWLDKEGYARLARGALETSRNYSIKVYVDKLLSFYQEALERAGVKGSTWQA